MRLRVCMRYTNIGILRSTLLAPYEHNCFTRKPFRWPHTKFPAFFVFSFLLNFSKLLGSCCEFLLIGDLRVVSIVCCTATQRGNHLRNSRRSHMSSPGCPRTRAVQRRAQGSVAAEERWSPYPHDMKCIYSTGYCCCIFQTTVRVVEQGKEVT